MNQNILMRLEKQAEKLVLDIPASLDCDEYTWLFNEMFAELIVRECVDIALEQKKQVEEMEVYNLQDEVWNRARIQQSEHIVDKIKEHFGVEE